MVLTFVNAAGQSVPPLIIHKGQHVKETWQLKAPGNMKITATERGTSRRVSSTNTVYIL